LISNSESAPLRLRLSASANALGLGDSGFHFSARVRNRTPALPPRHYVRGVVNLLFGEAADGAPCGCH
jgi:hypothetical protein